MENIIKYNKLTLIKVLGIVNRERKWLMRCDCGKEGIYQAPTIKRGKRTSCGCNKLNPRLSKYKSAAVATYSLTYYSWTSMKSRCKSPKQPNYYGKGITYCERWNNYLNFLEDMGERPNKMTLDRIDPYGNYEPSNCRWATYRTQAANKANTILLEYNNITKPLTFWADDYNLPYPTLHARITRGWSVQDALTRPIDISKHHLNKA